MYVWSGGFSTTRNVNDEVDVSWNKSFVWKINLKGLICERASVWKWCCIYLLSLKRKNCWRFKLKHQIESQYSNIEKIFIYSKLFKIPIKNIFSVLIKTNFIYIIVHYGKENHYHISPTNQPSNEIKEKRKIKTNKWIKIY